MAGHDRSPYQTYLSQVPMFFDPSPRNATVTAVSRTSLITLSREAFTAALTETGDLRDALRQGLAHRLHQLDAHG
jgi:CRP-like cAMP-binding protein